MTDVGNSLTRSIILITGVETQLEYESTHCQAPCRSEGSR